MDATADRLLWDERAGVLTLEGHVVAERAGAILRAARGRLDRAAGTLRLEGGVLAVQGSQVVIADAARIDLRAHGADLSGAVLFIKQGAPDLRSLDDPRRVPGAGRNALTARAVRVEQLPGGALLLRQVVATPCNCAAAPDYELVAETARVADDRAALDRPRLRLLGAELPLFPLSLPLLDRQSGLLAPQLGFAPDAGLRLAQPIYFAPARSWDLTLAPGLFTGSPGASSQALGARSVKGPRLGAELRWAPAEGSQGSLALDLLQDLAAGQSPGTGPLLAAGPVPGDNGAARGRGFGGLRGALRLEQRTEAGPWSLAASASLASDAMFLQDAQPAQLDRFLDVLRSDFGAWRRAGPITFGAAGVLLQDVRVADAADPDRRLFGPEARPTPQRLPSPFAQLAPVALGPLALSAEASAAVVVPQARSPHEVATGFSPTDLGAAAASKGPPDADLGRAAALRLDLAPRAALALPAGLPLRGRILLGGRADVWAFPGQSDRDARRAQGFAEAEAGATLARAFGDLLHTVEAEARLRVISPALLGGGPPPGDPADGGGSAWSAQPGASQQGLAAGLPCASGVAGCTTAGVPAARRALDELDGAASSTGAAQAALSLRQSIWTRPAAGAAPARTAWLTLQQDLVLADGAGGSRAADAVAALGLLLGSLSFSGELRWDWQEHALASGQARAALVDGRGDSVSASVIALRGAASDRIRAGVDELFASTRLAAAAGDLTGTLVAGLVWALPLSVRGLFAGYDLSWHLASGADALPPGVPNLVHSPSFAWRPACGCASLRLALDFPFRDAALLHAPSVRFLFDLQSLGR